MSKYNQLFNILSDLIFEINVFNNVYKFLFSYFRLSIWLRTYFSVLTDIIFTVTQGGRPVCYFRKIDFFLLLISNLKHVKKTFLKECFSSWYAGLRKIYSIDLAQILCN